ncbi:unannotated protein [freshwater metagenome]|uniref:Unannotated protein n=1 Tax=freshwater metagenome TaxID=449393 RepID=A0A6J6AS64_9ZZZZ
MIAVLFDSQREVVKLIVGLDNRLSALHVVCEEYVCSAWNYLAHECAQTNNVVAYFVEFLVEGLALFRHFDSVRSIPLPNSSDFRREMVWVTGN